MSHRPICRQCGANRASGKPHTADCPKKNQRKGQSK